MEALENCKAGKHSLKTIIEKRTNLGFTDSTEVVRWCSICGSVVIDLDTQGQTFPGSYMPMKSPLIFNSND